MLAPSHLWTAIAYVELNPVRAKIVRWAEDYPWSSAVAHVTGGDATGLLDMDWWRSTSRSDWREVLVRKAADGQDTPKITIPSYNCELARMRNVASEMTVSLRRWLSDLDALGLVAVRATDQP